MLVFAGASTSCRKKTEKATGSGKVTVSFLNTAAGDTLRYGSKWYVNQHGDSFIVNKFSYYITNIRLNKPDGTVAYAEKHSYHLLDMAAYHAFGLDSVPAGQYGSITFLLGVDSLHNVTGDQDGVLNPGYGMFKDWGIGYIMWKFEGTSPKSPQLGGKVIYHGQGYSGSNNVLRTITLPFPNYAALNSTVDIRINIGVDLPQLFASPNTANFATTNAVMEPSPEANKLADNFVRAFTLRHVGK
jgi:hypothetical protein